QMLIVASYELGQIIVLESALSYLGLGVQPPLPSWGMMVSEGQTYLEVGPWLSVLPSTVLFMLVAGVQFLSQAFTAENDASAEAARAKSWPVPALRRAGRAALPPPQSCRCATWWSKRPRRWVASACSTACPSTSSPTRSSASSASRDPARASPCS